MYILLYQTQYADASDHNRRMHESPESMCMTKRQLQYPGGYLTMRQIKRSLGLSTKLLHISALRSMTKIVFRALIKTLRDDSTYFISLMSRPQLRYGNEVGHFMTRALQFDVELSIYCRIVPYSYRFMGCRVTLSTSRPIRQGTSSTCTLFTPDHNGCTSQI